jgi:uncharacterized membrane protein YhaH (DUF805 family)
VETSNHRQKRGEIRKAKRVGQKIKSINMNYYLKVLQNYATFSGRARRSEYWYFFLFNVIIAFVLGFVGGLTKMPIISTIYTLAVLIPGIAVGVRRMHDVGKSGWFLLIPIYNLILACTDGVKGDNEYGADPKSNV